MRRFALLIPALLLCCLWWSLSALTGCANMIPPTGGPKDTLGPELVRAYPDNGTTGFKGKTINLQFNEYVQLDNLQSELLVNPPPERFPEITGKLRNVSIRLKDTLQPNTTYVLQFGDAIRDVNESNPFKNFTYAFSTGPYLDSLTLSGQVIDAETGLPDSTLIVMLHSDEADSAVAKKNPRYATRPDGKGMFQFSFLPKAKFYLFALKDEGVKKYMSPRTMFGFYDGQVETGLDTAYQLRAFVGEPEEQPREKSTSSITGGGRKKEEKVLRISKGSMGEEVDLLDTFFLQMSAPIKAFDSLKFRFTDTNYNNISGYRFSLDSTGRILQFIYNWKPDAAYRMIVQRGFATDTTGTINPSSDTLQLKTKAESDYGTIKIKLNKIDASRKLVLQWVQQGKVIKSYPMQGNSLRIPLFVPGEYNIRLLYDDNGNGRWDTGDYWAKKQPELVLAIDKKLNVKANWDNEFEVDF